jgi:hypothetical protein
MTPRKKQALIAEMKALSERIGTIRLHPERGPEAYAQELKLLGVPAEPEDFDPNPIESLVRAHPDWGADELKAWWAGYEARHQLQSDHMEARLRDGARLLKVRELLGIPEDMTPREWLAENEGGER